jgi:hypothetical protein
MRSPTDRALPLPVDSRCTASLWLLHSARQLVRVGTGDLGGTIDSHLLQRGLGAAERLGERQPEMLHHRLGDLPADAQRRVERRERILEHGPDPPTEDVAALRRRELGKVLALEQDAGSNRAPAPIGLRCRMGVGDGLSERSGGCRTGLAVSLRADLSTCSKRGLCWPSQPEWRASLGWWIGGDGIMRCRC